MDTTHPYYTLHADFWNTWQTDPLAKLEANCSNSRGIQPPWEPICPSQNIDDNDQVDSLQDPPPP